ncbi:type I restriction-modification system subunit M [Bacillus wiedmannii]|uniref:type I restriction-modification system subunit M n=1 Tax=Bacillus wiedmannii TaxID=1890302 RepID=UPI000BF00422|nr:type I restriction-modification system subunit M [Bacillus wiedmannii]PEL19433.1 type I restriction-modification system subunit M [Bacillus wiedmannii]PGZ96694.1 type I restriction-modification system subunit M [Bacillus wiedmannii]PHD24549.1 type I restriction-modification system subunit M [Bacillus wiedmannii]
MNKNQLATKIWESANNLRGKMEANEYKDYILGFIFYKFLSDNEVAFLKKANYTDNDIKNLTEDDAEQVKYIQDNLGYFISYENMFQYWNELGAEFTVDNVITGLSSFNKNIGKTHKKVFKNILKTLDQGITNLGDNAQSRTKAIRELIRIIKDIPTDNKSYDVLGFVYEYLISQFASNAGKKAGEFYTPHEVSVVMAELIAHHTKILGKEHIDIYDPTSGSGSLLINIGSSVAKHMKNKNAIRYYAQELKENTYNLTRMNLIMRGIIPDNIVVRNGDTLEEDWPYFDENENGVIEGTYTTLRIDAVVANPPYSQRWDVEGKESDPRFSEYGLAPKTKADYAFLLHNLYHLSQDGIMTIVLPHGVLFRGNEEENIRKRLIENGHIDTIIGLPTNIFFGTSIPTLIMVLKKNRENNDVLFVDASQGFEKQKNQNVLRQRDIKKIFDTVINRTTEKGYSYLASYEDIKKNDYKLNIPRYVDPFNSIESVDLYASIYGGIPKKELFALGEVWETFPSLFDTLFNSDDSEYVSLKGSDLKSLINENQEVINHKQQFAEDFADYHEYLYNKLIDNMETINVPDILEIVSTDLFERLKKYNLVDKYYAYQLLSDCFVTISEDLEMIQSEGIQAIKRVDPNEVEKVRKGKKVIIQDGWLGHILPFELVQKELLNNELANLHEKKQVLINIDESLNEIKETLSEEENEFDVLNSDNSKFIKGEVNKKLDEFQADIELPEKRILDEYLMLSNKEKDTYVEMHPGVEWGKMTKGKSGYSKTEINKYLKMLLSEYHFPENTFAAKLSEVSALLDKQGILLNEIRTNENVLHELTKETIESLTDEEALRLLDIKWNIPILSNIKELLSTSINDLITKIKELNNKYSDTLVTIEEEMESTNNKMISLLNDFKGSDLMLQALDELREALGDGRKE